MDGTGTVVAATGAKPRGGAAAAEGALPLLPGPARVGTAYCPLCRRSYPFRLTLWLEVSRRVRNQRFYERPGPDGFAWLRW